MNHKVIRMVGRGTCLFVLAVAASMLVLSAPVMADDGTEVHYCYGELAVLEYEYKDVAEGVTVNWTVETYSDGSLVSSKMYSDKPTISVDLTGVDYAMVTQTAIKGSAEDSKTIRIEAMHVKDDDDAKFTVTFHENDKDKHVREIDGTLMVHPNELFVNPPEVGSRDGYTFLGWYYQDASGREVQFDPYEPVYSDMDVYAKWVNNGSGSQGGSGTGTVDVDSHVVTFQTEPGMYYTVMGKGQGFVSFTVSVIDGFRYEDISVTSDSGTVTYQNGAYILSGITRDTVVTVTGERMYTVEYHMPDGVSVSAYGYGENPGLVSAGPLVMVVSGPSDMVITVLMGSEDVTDRCVSGDTVSIGEVTGNLFVLVVSTSAAQDSGDGFPWWLVALAIVLIAIVAIVYMYLRFRS